MPVGNGVRVDMKTGRMEEIKKGRFGRMKCGVVKQEKYVYLLGGFVTEKKIKTSTCERYNLVTE